MSNQYKGKIIDFSNKPWYLKDILPLVFEKQLSDEGYSEYLFYQDKYLPGLPRRLNPNFILNKIDPPYFLLVQSTFGHNNKERDSLGTILGFVDLEIKVLISTKPLDSVFTQVAINKDIINIVVEDVVFNVLQTFYLNPASLNLSNEKLIINDRQFNFSVDKKIKDVIQKGMSQIEHTMMYKDAIKQYERNFNSFD